MSPGFWANQGSSALTRINAIWDSGTYDSANETWRAAPQEFLAANDLTVRTGSPAQPTSQDIPSWLLDATTTEGVSGSIILPEGLTSVNVDVVWANWTTDAGDVKFRLSHKLKADGEAVSGATVDNEVTVTAGSQFVRATTRIASSIAVTADDLFGLNIYRLGGDAADTKAGDVAVFGLLVSLA